MADNMEDLMAALNGHQITDESGQVVENTTPVEEPASQETNTEDETARVETPAETQSEAPKATDEETEIERELAEDESGKRYVPQSRFDKEYGKRKALERELAAERQKQSQGYNPSQQPAYQAPAQTVPVNKADALETELLHVTLPQFNPQSPEYNRDLDELGTEIFRANPGITKLEAGRRAISRAKKFVSQTAEVAAEARNIKAQTSDQGITNRVTSRQESAQVDPDKMSLEQKEAWLKANGQW